MTRVLQPQRDIDRERERGRRRERKRERVRERERGREREREREGKGDRKENMEKYNVSNRSAHEARYHDAANDMCYLILVW